MTVKLKDNSLVEVNELDEVGNIIKMISNKSIKKLNAEGFFVFPNIVSDMEDVSSEDFIIQSVDGRFKTTNIIGLFQCENEQLVIESRFSDENNFFISYLLQKVIGVPNILSTTSTFDFQENIINLLMYIFPLYLKNAVKKGLYKTYVRKVYNDANIKGPINISNHIKSNTPFKGSINYSQRELTSNNYLINLIRHTIEFIKQKPGATSILYQVKDEVKDIVEATSYYKFHDRLKIIEENKKNPIRHAYYSDYRVLQDLCILILNSSNHNIGTGTSKVNGIIFDVAWLWEEYVSLILTEDFYHPKNKSKNANSGVQWLFTKVNDDRTQKTGQVYPDFISINTQDRVIVDAKYKPYNNIGNKDYLQLLAYMFRFDSKKGYYIYPESSYKDNLKYHLNQGTSYDNNITIREDSYIKKVGIKIPTDVHDYNTFCNLMKMEEDSVKLI